MKKLPRKIIITITEEDRQSASPYGSATECILCAALRRKGLPVESCDMFSATIGEAEYDITPSFNSAAAHSIRLNEVAPFYGKGVVGTSLTLTLQKLTPAPRKRHPITAAKAIQKANPTKTQ